MVSLNVERYPSEPAERWTLGRETHPSEDFEGDLCSGVDTGVATRYEALADPSGGSVMTNSAHSGEQRRFISFRRPHQCGEAVWVATHVVGEISRLGR